jgi:hypothetical protein
VVPSSLGVSIGGNIAFFALLNPRLNSKVNWCNHAKVEITRDKVHNRAKIMTGKRVESWVKI